MTKYWNAAMRLAAVAAVTGFSFAADAGVRTTRLEAGLVGVDSPASGKATWERRGGTSCLSAFIRCKLSVEVEDFPADGDFPVTACGVNIGDITVTGGFGDLNLDKFNGDAVPNCARGDTVTVGSPADVDGTFRRK